MIEYPRIQYTATAQQHISYTESHIFNTQNE